MRQHLDVITSNFIFRGKIKEEQKGYIIIEKYNEMKEINFGKIWSEMEDIRRKIRESPSDYKWINEENKEND